MKGLCVCLAALICLAVISHTTPPLAAQEVSAIRPGGSYTISVQVRKPTYVRLEEGKWEVRAYFYSGMNCYNTGSWWQSGSSWIYSGWYAHRVKPPTWSGEPEYMTFSISTQVVNYPRPSDDISHDMNEIPIGDYIKLRVRLLIPDINPKISGGYVTFTVGGTQYTHKCQEDQYTPGEYTIQEGDLNARVDKDYQGKYRLIIDQTIPISVENNAPASGTITITSPLNLALSAAAAPPPSYEIPFFAKAVISVVVVIAIIAAAVFLALRGRTGESLESLPT